MRPLICQMQVMPGFTERRLRNNHSYRSDFIRQGRARTNQTHLAAQDIEQLRQFINAGFAQKPADAGDARIVFDFECRAVPFIEMQQIAISAPRH